MVHTLSNRQDPHSETISDSIILFAGGNSEQMATIVSRLTTISNVHGDLFFVTNLPWPHEVFIEVLALGGEVCLQVNGMAEVQGIAVFHVRPTKDLFCLLFFYWKFAYFAYFTVHVGQALT